MSFISVIGKIGHAIATGIGIAAPFEPLVAAVPVVGPVADTLFKAIIAVEQLIVNPGAGPEKKAAVTGIVNAVHPGLNQDVLSHGIDAVVAALNALQAAAAKVPAPEAAPAK